MKSSTLVNKMISENFTFIQYDRSQNSGEKNVVLVVLSFNDHFLWLKFMFRNNLFDFLFYCNFGKHRLRLSLCFFFTFCHNIGFVRTQKCEDIVDIQFSLI